MENFLSTLTVEEALALEYEWQHFWARPEQLPPEGNWVNWLVKAGRGFGKTRTGAEFVRSEIENGNAIRVAIVGPTIRDVREVMIEGPSGILAVCPPWNMPTYEPSRAHKLTWPNGAVAFGYSAEEPDRLRGPQHDLAWGDEIAAWRYEDALDQLKFGLRLNTVPRGPRACFTTTPRPNNLMRELLKEDGTVVTNGSTYDNRANLADSFFKKIITKFEGTRLGRQELEAEMLDDTPGALWTYKMLDATRIKIDSSRIDPKRRIKSLLEQLPRMQRIVVAVDPSGTKGPVAGVQEDKSNDVGITVQGKGVDGHGYLLADMTVNGSPAVWSSMAVEAYHTWGADKIVAERNYGGAMVEHVIRSADPNVAYKEVTASRGKSVRAEPVAALYEQKKCHNVGAFAELETQMTQMTTNGFTGSGSPDRLDAAVWGFTELLLAEMMPPPAVVVRATHHRRH